ncbi:Ribonuclease H [Lachnellula occidentalis]|uniref:ribonuclease H n=1 Tax=Lachnellula occidentalis TaxID=215460 RepID=A0A8H8RH05_9HELO|nr:Ribonuclease H [Lachnellula occidentalis]
MVFIMKIYVDGGCRGNGKLGAIGAASSVFKYRSRRQKAWTQDLPENPLPTNQRAEIIAVILALEKALIKYAQLRSSPRLNVKIYSDSKYAIGCMTEWIQIWSKNGWINATGKPVANQDLIIMASELDDRLREGGKLKYVWIPRSENEDADGCCNQAMDKLK